MRRSEFVTVPSFSPQAWPGRSTALGLRAAREVSEAVETSETTSRSSRPSAARTPSASGIETAGLVPMIHSARISPARTASNSATALWPGPATRWGAPQKRATRSRSRAEKPMWAASIVDRPPTSRPPMALGWPVSENGPAPGRPIRPVARWQLMMLPALSVPCADWFTP